MCLLQDQGSGSCKMEELAKGRCVIIVTSSESIYLHMAQLTQGIAWRPEKKR